MRNVTMRNTRWFAVALLTGRMFAVQVPVGTELHIRLTDKIASNLVKPKQPVKAVLIAPVVQHGEIVVPAGAELTGVVKSVQLATDPKQRAILDLDFTELNAGGKKAKVNARVASVDNARETVDEAGKILGIAAGETLAARIDQGIRKMSEKYAGLADVLKATKDIAGVKEAEGNIVYDSGAELTVKLTRPLDLKSVSDDAFKLEPFSSESELIDMVTAQPFRTFSANPPRASDITNLMFVGTQAQLEKAFTEAGWSTAAALSGQSKMETMRAVIEGRGYKEAPVSLLLLDDRPPDLVFQKQNNTFAQRHHLRIWRRPGDFDGMPIWVCAATHDIGIDFSEKDYTFIHKIDPEIDRERTKVVNDLLFTRQVKSLALVDRERVPQHSQNATGDNLETDGKMAVLMFR